MYNVIFITIYFFVKSFDDFNSNLLSHSFIAKQTSFLRFKPVIQTFQASISIFRCRGCSGIELWSTFSEFTNPDKLKHSSPECSFAERNALSAPVTTCAHVKTCTTGTCSNTSVIDAPQALLRAPTAPSTPQATTTPSLPPGWS